jgi:pimeloyl-ACP methyl ester carboxylesterase
VLVHGLSGFSGDWHVIGPALADNFYVVALDLRGFGESDRASDGKYGVPRDSQDIAAFIRALGLSDAVVVAHSRGARSALLVAADNPGLVGKLVMVDSAPEPHHVGSRRVRQRIAGLPESFASIEEAMENLGRDYPGYTPQALRSRMEAYLRQLPGGRYEIKRDPQIRATMQRIERGEVKPPPEQGLWSELESLQCPVLLVWGDQSDMVTPELVERMRQAQPAIQVKVLSGVGHNIPAEAPKALLRELQEFLR